MIIFANKYNIRQQKLQYSLLNNATVNKKYIFRIKLYDISVDHLSLQWFLLSEELRITPFYLLKSSVSRPSYLLKSSVYAVTPFANTPMLSRKPEGSAEIETWSAICSPSELEQNRCLQCTRPCLKVDKEKLTHKSTSHLNM